MAQTRKLSQVPEYGWTRKTLLSELVLGEAGGMNPSISTVVSRPPGALRVGVVGRVDLASSGSSGFFGYILEGSNTGGDAIALTLNTLGGGSFVVGETITGGASGATGVITEVGTLSTVPGTAQTIVFDTWNEIDFVAGEGIVGGTSGGTADIFNVLSEWIRLGATNLNEFFDASATGITQIRLLGLSRGISGGEGLLGSGVVPCGRWSFLRVRTFVASGTPTFDMDIRLTAIAGDGEAREEELTLVRVSGATTEPESAFMIRPEGTRFLSAQLIVDTMINVPTGVTADGFNFRLQAALDQEAADAGGFVTIDILGPFQVTGQTRPFANGQVRLIDLGSFNFFRVIGEKNTAGSTVSDDLSSYTVRALINFDSNDWIDGERGIGFMPEALQEMFVQIHFGEPVSIGGNIFEIRMQVCNINLQPLRNTRPVGLLLADSQAGALEDLTVGASFTTVSKGTLFGPFGAGNVALIQTDIDGEAVFRIDTGGSTTFLYAWNSIPEIPENALSDFGPGQLIIATERVEIPAP